MRCGRAGRLRVRAALRVAAGILWFTPALALASCGARAGEPAALSRPPERIVSMAPSTTEILFALGQGKRVVGVTRFCDWPAEATNRPRVGGFLDPSYEVIVALRPDLVVLVTAHREVKRQLERLGLRTLTVRHDLVADVPSAIRALGRICGVPEKAETLVAGIQQRLDRVRALTAPLERPRVLISVGRDVSTGELGSVYVAGRHNFHNEVIDLAGGVNAWSLESPSYPTLSQEALVRLRPDVIIDLVGTLPAGVTRENIAAQWKRLGDIPAVVEGRVHVIVGGHALRPGPRLPDYVEELARLLHPEVKGLRIDGPESKDDAAGASTPKAKEAAGARR